jgi:zinc protease
VPDRPILQNQSFQQRIVQLPSGLRVLVQEDHHAPLVAVVTVVGSGSIADPPGQEQLAHLVEHLAYRRIDDRLRRLGATYNATTEADRTTFFALAHRDQLDELLAIRSGRSSSRGHSRQRRPASGPGQYLGSPNFSVGTPKALAMEA